MSYKPFLPGNCANPTGRPKKTQAQKDFEEKSRQYLAEFGFEQIKGFATGNDKKAKQWALEVFLDRGFGRAIQAIDADITTRGPDPTPESVAAQIAGIVGGETGSGGGVGIVVGEVAKP